MPLYQNQTSKAILVDLSGNQGVIDHAPGTIRSVAPNEIVAGALSGLVDAGLTKLVGAEQLGDVVASNVQNTPFGRLVLKSGNLSYEFSKHCHLMDTGSMAANNHELFGKEQDCLVVDSSAAHEFKYFAKVIPNTLAVVA